MSTDKIRISFWGVRGSIAAPLTSDDIAKRVIEELIARPAWNTRQDILRGVPNLLWTHGGNTSCVMVEVGDERIILDMGTGIRPLGNSLMKELFAKKGLRATFLISHVHWDHIQGLPFFGPLYMNRHDGFANHFDFYGGTEYRTRLDDCLRGQMDAPNFPISFREIELQTEHLTINNLHDGYTFEVGNKDHGPVVVVTCRKLDHPQEVYGFRLECNGKVIAYTTDHEPRLPETPYKNLLRLVNDADVWITDCQYSGHQYRGVDGPQRFGWGHAYPEAIGLTARLAQVKRVVTFHHDPSNDTRGVEDIAFQVMSSTSEKPNFTTQAAYEGLVVEL